MIPFVEVIQATPDEACRLAFRVDLRQVEQTYLAEVAVWPTTLREQELGLPSGVIVSTDRGAHGAEVHLTWNEAEQLVAELSRLIAEASIRQ
jgi:hypothetical protein